MSDMVGVVLMRKRRMVTGCVDGLLMSCGGGRGKMLIRKWRERISSEVAEG
jgi:hypothetical protein